MDGGRIIPRTNSGLREVMSAMVVFKILLKSVWRENICKDNLLKAVEEAKEEDKSLSENAVTVRLTDVGMDANGVEPTTESILEKEGDTVTGTSLIVAG